MREAASGGHWTSGAVCAARSRVANWITQFSGTELALMNLDIFAMQAFNGLSLFTILVLMALGLAIVFGLMGVINMAHGELMAMGA